MPSPTTTTTLPSLSQPSTSLLHSLSFARPSDHLEFYTTSPPASDHPTLLATADADRASASYLLLDLPQELLEPVQRQLIGEGKDGDSLEMELRGRAEDEVVLTTASKTYSLRTVQNSNSVLICRTAPDGSGEGALGLRVLKVVNETVELADVTRLPGTRLSRIKDLLQSHLYTGEANEAWRHEAGPAPVTPATLAEDVRASDAEISARLAELHVVWLGDGLRMLSLGYLAGLLAGLLAALDELGLAGHEECALGPLVDLLGARHDVAQPVLLQLLARYASAPLALAPTFDGFDAHQTTAFRISEIVALIGLSMLLSIKPTRLDAPNTKDSRYIQSVGLTSFLDAWKTRVGPDRASHCVAEHLLSHAVLSDDQTTLLVVPVDQLSTEPKTRMSQLFELRPRWRLAELERFVVPITGGGVQKKLDELVLKYCRKVKLPDKAVGGSRAGAKVKQGTGETVWLTARNKW